MLAYFIFKPFKIKYYLNGLNYNDGYDPKIMFPLFLKKTADLVCPKLDFSCSLNFW